VTTDAATSDWSPDGRRIAFDFADDTGVHNATMDPDGRHVRQLTFGRGIREIPRWSSDGRWITFNVVVATPDFVDFPAWGTHPPER
jgi:Tol biopolymer transport system component